jgi:hypothetical protein
LVTVALLGLSACVAGQSIDLRYIPDSQGKLVANDTIAVQVEDKRPYVLNKDKDPSYIGHYRAGFGNTWSVTTLGDRPLADVLRRDIAAELGALGFTVTTLEQAKSTIKVTIQDWNFDTYLNGRFWYKLDVLAKGGNGTVLAEKSMNDETVILGNFWTGAKYAFEEELPKIYNKVLRSLVRQDKALLDKLQGR